MCVIENWSADVNSSVANELGLELGGGDGDGGTRCSRVKLEASHAYWRETAAAMTA